VSREDGRAQSAVVHEYVARRKDMTAVDYNAALTILARAEHRLGEVLTVTLNHKGLPGPGRGHKTADMVSVVSGQIPKEITQKQSSRAQQLARFAWTATS
jgi:hypothetical protein